MHAKVAALYHGKCIKGRVKATFAKQGVQKWVVRFSDGYIRHYTRNDLEKILVRECRRKTGRQLDYILVSTRWKSCVTNCKPRWGPAIHRDIHGERNDHALVECSWKWRIKMQKSKPSKDFECLYASHVDDQGAPVENPTMVKFEAAITEHLQGQQFDTNSDTTTALYAKMCTAIQHAIDTVLPDTTVKPGIRRKVSDHTRSLYEKRTRLRGQGTPEQYQQVNKDIKESSLRDFENWVEEWAGVIGEANGRGDTKRIYKSVKVLARKPEAPSPNLTTDQGGKTLECAQDVAAAWKAFLQNKFKKTNDEIHKRRPMEPLPCTQGADELTAPEIKRGIMKMSNGKACGPDSIPAELYKRSKVCYGLLEQLLQKIWETEDVPVSFAQTTFKMIFKNKGSTNDPSKYRCIGLLNHAYKALSQCLLARQEKETSHSLSDWQAGFRKQRGCRDNILTLRAVYDEMLEAGKSLYVTFIDYSVAFDSVSHKFLDQALKAAGASNKSRALFRTIYKAASATTKVHGTDGKEIYSDPFQIDRGVVQGDITSSLYFILALELILKTHDKTVGKAVAVGGKVVDTLGYADDAALLDNSRRDCATLADQATQK